MSILKDPRVREKEFLGYVARGPCVVCLSAGVYTREVHVAHIRSASPEHGKRPTGGAEKPSDRWTTPLCPTHHTMGGKMSQHDFPGGELAFWQHHGINPFDLSTALYKAFERGEDSRPIITRFAAAGARERNNR